VAVAVLTRSPACTSPKRFVLGVVAGVLLLRLTYLGGALHPDEAGYLMVARAWHAGGPNLYGHYFVDRPPLLIALYGLAALVGWDLFIRVIASLLCMLFVVAAAWAAHEAVGPRGVRWAAMVAGAFAITPVLQAQEADGEILAVPFVMLGMALTLAAVRRRSVWLAVAAGFAAGSAVLVKQNFGDAVVFAFVLLVASVWQARLPVRAAARVALGGVAGGALTLALSEAYVVWSRVGFAVAWNAVFGFRGTALDVIEDHSLHAPMMRALGLVGLSLLSGVLPLLVMLLSDAWRSHFSGPPVAWAVGAALLLDAFSIASGGSYWPHYLFQLGPALALAAGVWAADSARVRTAAGFVVASAVASTCVVALTGSTHTDRARDVGAWVARSSRPGDTATVLFGNADVQEATGLPSPYRQIWTLPMRTFDPHLAHLRRVLAGTRAPTWVVAWGDLDPWHIDAHDRMRLTLAMHYHEVGTLCGHVVYLHDGLTRHLAPRPQDCTR
jgi:4-amino-4-deoxy-L-arabinose transferase-like glycosyltransferase